MAGPASSSERAAALLAAARRLAANLDGARLYQASAYAAMAAAAIEDAAAAGKGGAVNDNVQAADVELEFHLDAHDRVWMIRDGDCYILGGKEQVRAEMWRFLRVLLPELG